MTNKKSVSTDEANLENGAVDGEEDILLHEGFLLFCLFVLFFLNKIHRSR